MSHSSNIIYLIFKTILINVIGYNRVELSFIENWNGNFSKIHCYVFNLNISVLLYDYFFFGILLKSLL